MARLPRAPGAAARAPHATAHLAGFVAPFVAHCVELLSSVGPVQTARLFGGHALRIEGLMVGLIAGEQVYLKTDAQTVARWQAAGGRPFAYTSRRGEAVTTTALGYWTPPDEALDSPASMRPWGRLALEAALRAQTARAGKAAAAAARRSTPTAAPKPKRTGRRDAP